MSFLTTVLELLYAAGAPGATFAALLLLAPPAHIFAQLRGAYGLTVF